MTELSVIYLMCCSVCCLGFVLKADVLVLRSGVLVLLLVLKVDVLVLVLVLKVDVLVLVLKVDVLLTSLPFTVSHNTHTHTGV